LTENEVYLQFTSESDIKYLSVGKMNYLGWRYIEVPTASFEGNKDYYLTGVKLTQVPSQMSAKGDFSVNNIQLLKNGIGGVTDITADQMTSITVHPNPASDYLVANADGLIESVELINQNGQLVAATAGNVLNVSDITPGVYMARITTAQAIVVRKVIISHNL
ncbi:MAG: T9SS type A sorting domain-containing protein, partial [Muribaculaceae bacterium]|nr:T9SS type A sorting domain-containing protein [Muribaculaceae bacterium]